MIKPETVNFFAAAFVVGIVTAVSISSHAGPFNQNPDGGLGSAQGHTGSGAVTVNCHSGGKEVAPPTGGGQQQTQNGGSASSMTMGEESAAAASNGGGAAPVDNSFANAGGTVDCNSPASGNTGTGTGGENSGFLGNVNNNMSGAHGMMGGVSGNHPPGGGR